VAPSGELRGKGKCGVFAGKTVWSSPERLRGELLTMRRYTNLRLPLPCWARRLWFACNIRHYTHICFDLIKAKAYGMYSTPPLLFLHCRSFSWLRRTWWHGVKQDEWEQESRGSGYFISGSPVKPAHAFDANATNKQTKQINSECMNNLHFCVSCHRRISCVRVYMCCLFSLFFCAAILDELKLNLTSL